MLLVREEIRCIGVVVGLILCLRLRGCGRSTDV